MRVRHGPLCATRGGPTRTVDGVYAEPINQRPRRAVRPSPIFLAFVAVTVVGAVLSWTNSNSVEVVQVGVFLLVFGGWIVSVCLHEFAHAYTAYRAGDRSVESAGYLTLNPFKYTHPLLSIVLPLYFIAQGGIGLPGGAVYLHPHAFRSRAQRSLASAVGPLTNLVFAIVLLRVASGRVHLVGFNVYGGAHVAFWAGLSFLGFLQISAAILNLLPIPGLDGYGIIEPYLSPETARSLAPDQAVGHARPVRPAVRGAAVQRAVPRCDQRRLPRARRRRRRVAAGLHALSLLAPHQLTRARRRLSPATPSTEWPDGSYSAPIASSTSSDTSKLA